MGRIVQRHVDAGEPDVELLPDPEEPWCAYRMAGYLLALYAPGAEMRAGHLVPQELAVADHRDLLLLQRYIETQGAYAGLHSAYGHGVSWRSLVDGVHIRSASTLSSRHATLREALGPGSRNGVGDAALGDRRQKYITDHLGDALRIAESLVADMSQFDFPDASSRSDLLWVIEQADEARRGQGGEQLPTALRCLVEDLQGSREAHSPRGRALLAEALAWRRTYRQAVDDDTRGGS